MKHDQFKIWKKNEANTAAEDVAFESITIDRPTLVFFSGFMSFHSGTKTTFSRLKIFEKMLQKDGVKNKTDYQVFTATYKNKSTLFNALSYCGYKNYSSKTSQHFVNSVIMPLVLDEHGAPRDKVEVSINLRNLTLGGYSVGTVIVQELYNASTRSMVKAGFSKKDTKELLGDVVCISMGTMSTPSREGKRFKTVYMVATNDRFANIKNKVFEASQALKKKFNRTIRDLRISRIADNAIIIRAEVNNNMTEPYIDKIDGQKKWRPIRKLYPETYRHDSGHELSHYISEDDNQAPFSRICRFVLANAIERDSNVTIDSLIQPYKEVRTKHYARQYTARIEAAKTYTP